MVLGVGAAEILSGGMLHAVYRESDDSKLPGRYGGPRDAYRHILLAAESTRLYGATLTRSQLSMHEDPLFFRLSANERDQANIDLVNNEIGIKIGQWVRDHHGNWNDVVRLSQEVIQKSFANVPPETFDKSKNTASHNWHYHTANGRMAYVYAQPEDIANNRASKISLSNGIEVTAPIILPMQNWTKVAGTTSIWPDNRGEWMHHERTYKYPSNWRRIAALFHEAPLPHVPDRIEPPLTNLEPEISAPRTPRSQNAIETRR